MNRTGNLLVWGALLAWGTCSLQAEDPPKVVQAVSAPNAAGIYWHAFAAIPRLDDEQKKLLRASAPTVTAPLPDELVPLVARYERALHELHRARSIVPCDWQLDATAGPGLVLIHVDKALDLSHVALLRARQRWIAGETDAALSDVLAVFKLARDCGASPIVVSLHAGAAIEQQASAVLTAHITRLKKEQLHRLMAALRELPSTADLASTILDEERMICDWLEREINDLAAKWNDPLAGGRIIQAITAPLLDRGGPGPDEEEARESKRRSELLDSLSVADVRESLKRMRSDYAELHRITALPFAERAERVQAVTDPLASVSKMKTRDDAMRYLSVVVMPLDWNAVFAREEQVHVRRQLLDEALRIQRDGAAALREIHGRKVEYRKTPSGFELHCLVGDKPEVLSVGDGK
jgi:hypothetical protein